MKILAYFNCLVNGHNWHVSRSRKGQITCSRCRVRKRIP